MYLVHEVMSAQPVAMFMVCGLGKQVTMVLDEDQNNTTIIN